MAQQKKIVNNNNDKNATWREFIPKLNYFYKEKYRQGHLCLTSTWALW